MQNEVISKRVDFMMIFDVTNGNPNGDPGAENLPRVFSDGRGYITNLSIKRKIRDFVISEYNDVQGMDIFIQPQAILNNKLFEMYKLPEIKEDPKLLYEHINASFFDCRTFGQMMDFAVPNSKKPNNRKKGKTQKEVVEKVDEDNIIEDDIVEEDSSTKTIMVGNSTGPVQICDGVSFDSVEIMPVSIVMSATKKEEKSNGVGLKDALQQLGSKNNVVYGLYAAKGFINPAMAQSVNTRKGTGFTNNDKEILFEAIKHIFQVTQSATRGEMHLKYLIVFEHDSKWGNVASDKLFNTITVAKKVNEPTKFEDYNITLPTQETVNKISEQVNLRIMEGF